MLVERGCKTTPPQKLEPPYYCQAVGSSEHCRLMTESTHREQPVVLHAYATHNCFNTHKITKQNYKEVDKCLLRAVSQGAASRKSAG